MKYTLQSGKGVNFDLPAWELEPGVWSACSNFRFRAGLDEMWEGGQFSFATAATPLWGMPFGTATKYAVYATSTKAYVWDYPLTETEITRKTDGQIITALSAVGTTVTVTTAAAHGLTAGTSSVTHYAAIPTAYNGTYTVATTPTATTYTYTAGSAPGAATTLGAYHGSAIADFSALSGFQRYTGGAFNGLFLFNHPGQGLFYWGGDTAVGFRRLPTFNGTSTWNTAVSVRPFKGFIVAIGKTENGTVMRQNVAWSDAVSDPGTIPKFPSTTTNLAGDVDLPETPGSLVDGLPLGDAFIIYATDARYAMQYLAGSDAVMQFTRLPGATGLAFPNCVVSTPVGHVFLTPTFDVMVHNGGEAKSIASGRVHDYLRSNIAAAYAHLSFLCVHPDKREVWVCYPSAFGATTVCDRALVWNWVDDTWGMFNLATNANTASGVAFACEGQWPNLTYFANQASLTLFAYNAGTPASSGIYNTIDGAGQWFGVDIVASLERTGMDLGDRDRLKTLQRSRWVIDGGIGDAVSIQHGSSKFSDTAPTYAPSVSYTVGTTDYANARATQGRFLAIKLTTTTTGTTIRLRSIDLDVTAGGTR